MLLNSYTENIVRFVEFDRASVQEGTCPEMDIMLQSSIFEKVYDPRASVAIDLLSRLFDPVPIRRIVARGFKPRVEIGADHLRTLEIAAKISTKPRARTG